MVLLNAVDDEVKGAEGNNPRSIFENIPVHH